MEIMFQLKTPNVIKLDNQNEILRRVSLGYRRKKYINYDINTECFKIMYLTFLEQPRPFPVSFHRSDQEQHRNSCDT